MENYSKKLDNGVTVNMTSVESKSTKYYLSRKLFSEREIDMLLHISELLCEILPSYEMKILDAPSSSVDINGKKILISKVNYEFKITIDIEQFDTSDVDIIDSYRESIKNHLKRELHLYYCDVYINKSRIMVRIGQHDFDKMWLGSFVKESTSNVNLNDSVKLEIKDSGGMWFNDEEFKQKETSRIINISRFIYESYMDDLSFKGNKISAEKLDTSVHIKFPLYITDMSDDIKQSYIHSIYKALNREFNLGAFYCTVWFHSIPHNPQITGMVIEIARSYFKEATTPPPRYQWPNAEKMEESKSDVFLHYKGCVVIPIGQGHTIDFYYHDKLRNIINVCNTVLSKYGMKVMGKEFLYKKIKPKEKFGKIKNDNYFDPNSKHERHGNIYVTKFYVQEVGDQTAMPEDLIEYYTDKIKHEIRSKIDWDMFNSVRIEFNLNIRSNIIIFDIIDYSDDPENMIVESKTTGLPMSTSVYCIDINNYYSEEEVSPITKFVGNIFGDLGLTIIDSTFLIDSWPSKEYKYRDGKLALVIGFKEGESDMLEDICDYYGKKIIEELQHIPKQFGNVLDTLWMHDSSMKRMIYYVTGIPDVPANEKCSTFTIWFDGDVNSTLSKQRAKEEEEKFRSQISPSAKKRMLEIWNEISNKKNNESIKEPFDPLDDFYINDIVVKFDKFNKTQKKQLIEITKEIVERLPSYDIDIRYREINVRDGGFYIYISFEIIDNDVPEDIIDSYKSNLSKHIKSKFNIDTVVYITQLQSCNDYGVDVCIPSRDFQKNIEGVVMRKPINEKVKKFGQIDDILCLFTDFFDKHDVMEMKTNTVYKDYHREYNNYFPLLKYENDGDKHKLPQLFYIIQDEYFLIFSDGHKNRYKALGQLLHGELIELIEKASKDYFLIEDNVMAVPQFNSDIPDMYMQSNYRMWVFKIRKRNIKKFEEYVIDEAIVVYQGVNYGPVYNYKKIGQGNGQLIFCTVTDEWYDPTQVQDIFNRYVIKCRQNSEDPMYSSCEAITQSNIDWIMKYIENED